MFTLKNISLFRGGRCLIEEAHLAVHSGDSVGLTGANGSGKSSLLLMLMGKLSVDSGEVQLPGKPKISWAEQETHATDLSALEFVLDGDVEIKLWQDRKSVV